MSYVGFNTRRGYAELHGSERAYASVLLGDLTCGLLRDAAADLPALRRRLVGPPSYLTAALDSDLLGRGPRVYEALSLAIRASPFGFALPGRGVTTAFELTLNTAVLVGNDTIRLLARLHGQCEIHGWIPAEERGWYADLIDAGRSTGLLRPDQGWESVADLCRADGDGPVVTDYSVTDSFPNPRFAGYPDDDDEDGDADWVALSSDEQWNAAIALLPDDRAWRPAGWAVPYFGGGATALDLCRV